MKKTLSLLFGMFLLIGLQAQEVAVDLSKKSIKIGEQSTFEWVLKLPSGIDNYQYPSFIDSLSSGIEIIEQSAVDTTFGEGNEPLRYISQRITITAWDSGYFPILPLTFEVNNKQLQSQPLLLQVSSTPIEQNADIKDITNILEVPFSLWDWILSNKGIIGSILGGIILLLLLYFLYKKYKRRSEEKEEVIVPKEAADIVALRKLEELKSQKLWQQDQVKEYYVSLSFIVREYIGNRYQIHALELTTDEIMQLANRQLDISEQLKRSLHQTLLLADMAKFARQKPIAQENEMAFKNAKEIVEQTALKIAEIENDENKDQS